MVDRPYKIRLTSASAFGVFTNPVISEFSHTNMVTNALGSANQIRASDKSADMGTNSANYPANDTP